jgi:hypothetical protein
MERSWKKYLERGELADIIAGKAPHAFLAFVLALTMVIGLRGIQHDSPTEDEWAHLVRGINYWQNRDMRIHVQHPPLANALDALPSAFDHNADLTQMKTWKDGYSPGLEYIKLDYEKARAQLNKGRYVAMLFLLALVAYVFYFCLSVFGWPTAAAAALLIAFNPSLLGQARYVATDMPMATMATIAVGELVRYSVRPIRILTLSLALAGMALSKHSGVVFIAILALVSLVIAALGKGAFRNRSPLRRLGAWLGHWLLAGAIVLFAINAAYKFDRTGMTVGEILDAPEPQHWVTQRFKGTMLETDTFVPRLPRGLPIPLPYPYFFGLFAVQEQNRMGYPTYFLGQSSQQGHWAYFPVLLLVKDPPAWLFLLGLGGVLLLRRQKRKQALAPTREAKSAPKAADELPPEGQTGEAMPEMPEQEATLVAPPSAKSARPEREPLLWGMSLASSCFLVVSLLFLLFVMRSHLNMGIRHALPFIPLTSVLAGRAYAHAGEWLSGDKLLAARAFGLSSIVSALLVMPHFLNYYNVLALGQGTFINVVGDDWGQDREAFVRFVKREKLEPLYYHAQTPTRKLEVDYLGLKYRSLDCKTRPTPGSWAAIHVQYVRRFEAKGCAAWMKGLAPTYKINDNIWIYRVPGGEVSP